MSSDQPHSGGSPFSEGRRNARLADEKVRSSIAAYRGRVAAAYRPVTELDIGEIGRGPVQVSRKIDGELWFLVGHDSGCYLTSPSGLVVSGKLPFLPDTDALPTGTIIAGELHGSTDGRRERVGDVAIARGGDESDDPSTLFFTGFDVVYGPDGALPDANYEARYEQLSALVKGSAPNIGVVETEVASNADELKALYQSAVVDGGAEGLIVRSGQGVIYKLKPRRDVDAVVLGFTQKSDEPELIRSVLLGLINEDDSYQLLGGCGSFSTEVDRRALHTQLSAIVTTSNIRYAAGSGALYTFVRPEVVITLRVSDLQGERSDGTAILGPKIRFEDGWRGEGMGFTPSPIHPLLERVREDKSATRHDVSFAQVVDRIPVSSSPGQGVASEPSELLRREVWTKATKGKTAVRKLVVWKTNKEQSQSGFPAYVVHWTDYSPGRAKPLTREVRLAPDEASAKEIADAMVESGVAKGWEKA